MAKKHLRKHITSFQNIELVEVDVLQQFSKFMKSGFKMIPALQFGEKKWSSVYMNEKNITSFLKSL